MDKEEKQNRMYSNLPNLVIAFHGCDKSTAAAIIQGKSRFKISRNKYDWLGNGMYFWEQNLSRAWQWANDGASNPQSSINTPAVLGAVIDLGYCLNLMDTRSAELLKLYYKAFSEFQSRLNKQIPQNRNVGNSTDLLLRDLDCSVIEYLHTVRKISNQRTFDSVRGLFIEGEEIYPNSGFKEKTHIQICVRNPNCIKGFFIPRDVDENWDIP